MVSASWQHQVGRLAPVELPLGRGHYLLCYKLVPLSSVRKWGWAACAGREPSCKDCGPRRRELWTRPSLDSRALAEAMHVGVEFGPGDQSASSDLHGSQLALCQEVVHGCTADSYEASGVGHG